MWRYVPRNRPLHRCRYTTASPFTDNSYANVSFEELEDEYGFDTFVNLACPGDDTREVFNGDDNPVGSRPDDHHDWNEPIQLGSWCLAWRFRPSECCTRHPLGRTSLVREPLRKRSLSYAAPPTPALLVTCEANEATRADMVAVAQSG